jgi:hypothetical protein
MKKLLVCAVLAFAVRTSGQAQVQKVPVMITSDYYAQPKVLVLHALNNSGKDIAGYTIIIRHKNPDGTLDKNGWSEHTTDMLSVLIIAQMAKDPTASERIRQQNIGNNTIYAAGSGIFVAGETRDMTLPGIDSGSELDLAAGAVFYTDGTYDEQDENSFNRMLTARQGQLQEMREEDELIRNALADTTNDHPIAAALTELNKRHVEAMEKPRQGFVPIDISNSNLKSLQQPQTYGDQTGKTERERLTQYVEDQEKKVQLMTPHCHLEIAPKQ